MLENVKSLGVLTQEQKEQRWKSTLSGSKVSAILGLNPYKSFDDQVDEDLGLTERAPLNRTAQMKTQMGHIMEPVILDLFDDYMGTKTTRDKDNYKRTDLEFCTGEFDAYDLNLNCVVDAKNTEKDLATVEATYEWQMRYYMWFGNFNTSYLAVLQNGWKFNVIEIKRDLVLEKRMVDVLQYYYTQTTQGVRPEYSEIREILDLKTNDLTSHEMGVEDIETLYEYADNSIELSNLNNNKKLIGEKLSHLPVGTKYKNSDLSVSVYETTRKGSIDLDLIVHDFPQIDFEQYRKPSSTSRTVKVTPSKAYKSREEIVENVSKVDYSGLI